MRGIIHPRGTGQGDGLFAVHWGKVIQRTPTRLLVTGLEEGLYGNPPRSLRQHKPVILPTSSYFVALRANQESKASAGCNNSILPNLPRLRALGPMLRARQKSASYASEP
jgi:hypothetical protein